MSPERTMSPKVNHIPVESILCLTTIPIHVSYQEEWLSYPVRIHWRNLFLLAIWKQKLMFSCLGIEPCFYFPFSMTEPPSDLNLCMLACIAAVSFSSCVHQFPCFLGSFYYIWPWVSFCLLFWLPQLPETWGKVFTKVFQLRLEYYKYSHSPTLLQDSGLYTSFITNSFTVVCCLRHWFLCVPVNKNHFVHCVAVAK